MSAEELLVLRPATGGAVVTAEELARALAKLEDAEAWQRAPIPGDIRISMGLEQLAPMVQYHRALAAQAARHG